MLLEGSKASVHMLRPVSRTLGALTVLSITAWILLDAMNIALAVMRASGPCQPDNEARW